MPTTNINVFISYSHDSTQHDERVLALADGLRADGLNCIIDQYDDETPAEGWPLWMENQIRNADFVLMVCTETYYRRVMGEEQPGKGLGARWEGNLILQHLYNRGVVNTKFIPIVFAESDTQYIPTPAEGATHYRVDTQAGYDALYRRLTNQPLTPKSAIGTIRQLPPRPRAPAQLSGSATLQPNLVHPYPLQANFTGRVTERQELTAWLADDARPICALVAMGGMGKSALAWYWVKNDVLPPAQPAAFKGEGMMWWSFYEGESSFAKFIDEALKYVSGQPTIDTARFPTTYDRAQELRKQLQNKRVLFVLDGFERQLRQYASLDAAYQRDDTTDPSHEERACVDPIAARWIRDIAAGTTRAKVLLTMRLMVSDLEDRAGYALEGVLKRELKELPRGDAVEFMRRQGVITGMPAEIAAACEAYGYHPLSLRLLSGLIANDARMPGDIAAAPRHDVHGDLVQRQHHILERSYNALPKRERALLSRIAAFRSPMAYDVLAIFNTFGNEARFDAALDNLRVRGLLQRDTTNNRYDLHPIVRHYAYDRLTDKTGVHNRLRDYFAIIPTLDTDKVQSIEDLASIIELYHHTLGAGLFDEAHKLHNDRLRGPLYYRLGEYELDLQLLLAIPRLSNGLPRLSAPTMQTWNLLYAAKCYETTGRPQSGLKLLKKAIQLNREVNHKFDLASAQVPYAMLSCDTGNLRIANASISESVKIVDRIGNPNWRGISHRSWGRALMLCGNFDRASEEFKIAWSSYNPLNRFYHGLSVLFSYKGQLHLWQNNPQQALECARQAHEFSKQGYYVREGISADWLAGISLIKIISSESIGRNAIQLKIDSHLTDALTRCRRVNLMELEPDILLAWARWHHARGNAQEALAYAEEALAIADRCEYRLKQAEIHNFLARLALDASSRETARQHAETAKERAWCDGPPHCYKPALDEAEGMLRELGAKE